MAKQGGILGLRGTVGGLVFSANGNVSQKPASRPITAARTLENNAEFGLAGSAGKLIRDAFRSISGSVRGKYLAGRLASVMNQIIKKDAVNPRGQREVLKANIGLLAGFNFSDASLSSVFYAPFTAAYNTGAGAAVDTVTIAGLSVTPANDLSAPQGATHYAVVAAAVQIDFATGEVVLSDQTQMTPLPIDGTTDAIGDIDMAFAAAPGAGDTTIVAVGLLYYQEVNGSYYALNNGASNALSIVYAA